MLKVDMSNAFNTVSRTSVLQGALQYCPCSYNFLRTAYRTQAPLFSGGRTLWSREGTHQGCPLGPLGFALALQPTLEKLHSSAALVWQSWYLDDGHIVGRVSEVLARLQDLQQTLPKLGLTSVFDVGRADLSGIAAPPPPLYVSGFLQKGELEVNERGTIAAVVTAFGIAGGAGRGEPPKSRPFVPQFVADHPFLYLIKDDQTGQVLFMGRVLRP